MLIDSSHRKWLLVTVLLLLLAVGLYVPYRVNALNGPSGGSVLGLVYGGAGSLLIVMAAVFGVRKKLRAWRIGRMETWMKGHIWLSLLSFPLILLHAGFRLGGPLTTTLMVVFAIVVVTGILGLVIQRVVPRSLMTEVPFETVYGQLDHVSRQLVAEADTLLYGIVGPFENGLYIKEIAGGPEAGEKKILLQTEKEVPKPKPGVPVPQSGPLKDFYVAEVRGFLDDGGSGPFTTSARASAVFERVRTLVPPDLHGALSDLEEICEERRQLEAQRRLHHWLHGWILIHGPLGIALVVLGAVHAVLSLRYGGLP